MPHLSYGGGNFPAHPLAPSVTLLRDKLLLDFSHSLTSKGTPPAILWDILHGFSAWLTPDSSHARAHTFGSLLTAGIALTSAFYEQYHKLGWYQTCWGRITRGWSKALEEYNIQAGTTLESQYWSSSLIENLRVLTMGLWRHRNQIEHGDSIEEQAGSYSPLYKTKWWTSIQNSVPTHLLSYCVIITYSSTGPWQKD